MANDDPIKDYNELNLKLDRLKEKMEMYVGYDDPVTDLHDCSNDLSDAGSRREEYEHAKYAERARQKINGNIKSGYDVWSKKRTTSNKKSNNTGTVIVVVIFVIFYLFSAITQIIEEFVSIFETSYNSSYSNDYTEEEIYLEEFELYADNIKTTMLTTKENETYVEIYNSNLESYEDLKLETIFYDDYGQIIQSKSTYVDILLGENYHYIKVLDVPEEYASCEINILDNYGEYTDISKDDFIVEFKDEYVGYDEETILLTNNCYDELYHLEVVIVYSNTDGVISFKNANFYDLDWGDVEEKKIYSYGLEDEEAEIVRITVNDLY